MEYVFLFERIYFYSISILILNLIKSSFDVDAFLAHYKREYSLERLKDDLNVFLKVLELSMSELINKDYPDFVNLSTNLVSFTQNISHLYFFV
jgi:hypothetical protein